MGYKQSPGRKNMPKTGRGIDAAALMTGSPAQQKQFKRNSDGTAPVDENSSMMNRLRGSVPAPKGVHYDVYENGKNTGRTNLQRGDILDFDGDGDSIFNDSNDDGTMLSRAIKAFSDGTARSDDKAARAKSNQQSINRRFRDDIKNKGFIQAVKDNFKF